MKPILILLIAISPIFSQTQISMPELNAEYTAPPGWDAGIKIVNGYHEYLIGPTKNSKTVFLTVRQFDDSLSMGNYLYQRLFRWVFQSSKDDVKIAASIPAIMDTTIGSIHFVGLETSGTKEVRVEYFKTNGLYLLSLWYRVSIDQWTANRDEYYKNFQNLNFITVNTGLVKRQADFGRQHDDGSKIFFNLLGKRTGSGTQAIQFNLKR